jgi:hypothetical protein
VSTPSTDISLSETAAEQIATLMDQVRSKDALVMQLTERLEQAAEQLDRLHRSGADKRHGGGGGGGSRELVEQTGALTTRVEEALEAWNQTGPQFDYICQRLDEIAGSMQGGHAPAKGSSKSSAPSQSSAPATPAAGGPGGSFWEKMKSNMMDGSPAPAPAQSSPAYSSAPANTPSQEASDTGTAPAVDEVVARISAPAPVIVDVETASIEDLREAVTTRDNYITALISELRTAEPFPTLPADLKNSGIAPEELLASVLDLESRLKTKVLREELDLSLERARIARERSKLEQVKAQLESQIKRLSGAAATESQGSTQAPAADDPATGKLSWLKRLKGNK